MLSLVLPFCTIDELNDGQMVICCTKNNDKDTWPEYVTKSLSVALKPMPGTSLDVRAKTRKIIANRISNKV